MKCFIAIILLLFISGIMYGQSAQKDSGAHVKLICTDNTSNTNPLYGANGAHGVILIRTKKNILFDN